MSAPPAPLTWLKPGQDFPPVTQSWGADSPAPGLLAGGGVLNVDTLCRAYGHGIFPWFSRNQPVLWWSPDPRMVLQVDEFRLHPSFRKTLRKFCRTQECEIRIDSAFEQVIRACATSPRAGQAGTWIVPDMISAYCAMHRAGFAHSVETWVSGRLVGALYCVALGKSVFGESMFSQSSEASKIALAALVCFCRHHRIRQIDCQQNTPHLASFGAREIARDLFGDRLGAGLAQSAPDWIFENLYWNELLDEKRIKT
ncbi:MAG: leucyl/phenylalanyl-tRNA--protein transferase [Rhodoferax sp.]